MPGLLAHSTSFVLAEGTFITLLASRTSAMSSASNKKHTRSLNILSHPVSPIDNSRRGSLANQNSESLCERSNGLSYVTSLLDAASRSRESTIGRSLHLKRRISLRLPS